MIDTSASRIQVLFMSGSPSAVAGRVWSVIVDAVNGMLGRRLRAHAEKERWKIVPPFGAHINAPAAVVLVVGALRVFATCDGGCPSVILGRKLVTGASQSVCGAATTQLVALQAATRTRLAVAQVLAVARDDRSAGAVTEPHRPHAALRGGVFGATHNSQTTELTS